MEGLKSILVDVTRNEIIIRRKDKADKIISAKSIFEKSKPICAPLRKIDKRKAKIDKKYKKRYAMEVAKYNSQVVSMECASKKEVFDLVRSIITSMETKISKYLNEG